MSLNSTLDTLMHKFMADLAKAISSASLKDIFEDEGVPAPTPAKKKPTPVKKAPKKPAKKSIKQVIVPTKKKAPKKPAQRELTLSQKKAAAAEVVGPLPLVIFSPNGENGPTGKLVEITKDPIGKFVAEFGGKTYKATRERDLRRKLRSFGVDNSDEMRTVPEVDPSTVSLPENWGNGMPVKSNLHA